MQVPSCVGSRHLACTFTMNSTFRRAKAVAHSTRIGDTVELDEHAVARGLDDAAAVLGDRRIDELQAMGLEARERPRLVDLHQPTVADHVSGKDRCQPALWSRNFHL